MPVQSFSPARAFPDALRLLTCIPFLSHQGKCLLRSLKFTLNVLPFVKPKPTLATNGLSGMTDRQDRISVHAGASCITPGATVSLPRR